MYFAWVWYLYISSSPLLPLSTLHCISAFVEFEMLPQPSISFHILMIGMVIWISSHKTSVFRFSWVQYNSIVCSAYITMYFASRLFVVLICIHPSHFPSCQRSLYPQPFFNLFLPGTRYATCEQSLAPVSCASQFAGSVKMVVGVFMWQLLVEISWWWHQCILL